MSDDEYTVPLQDQRPFGAGLKRKRVEFIPASTDDPSFLPTGSKDAGRSVADRYLSLVLPDHSSQAPSTPTKPTTDKPQPEVFNKHEPEICPICNLPVTSSPTLDSTTAQKPYPHRHATSLAHQLSLPHSHPPSSIDRHRKGLAYLSAHGWDPDSRIGLGSEGQGIRFPIIPRVKDDKLGLGVELPKEVEDVLKLRRVENQTTKEKLSRVGKAGKLVPGTGKATKISNAMKKKQTAFDEKHRNDRLQQLFYGSEDVARYLGDGG
jgi:hypothetical protein